MAQFLTCILNEKAGYGTAAKSQALVSKIAHQWGWEAHFLVSADGADLKSLAQKARSISGLVVGGGGDGTIAAVASALVGTDTTLGVLPMGTLNHFAKDLGIPLEIEKAVQNLFTGKISRVDVGDVNGRIFLNNSSIGFYPQIVRAREREQRQGRSKWVAFAKATVHILQKSRRLHVCMAHDHGPMQTYDTPFVFIGNNRYNLAGLEIGTRAALDSGKLWVCAAPKAGRFSLFVLAVETLLGIVSEVDLAAFETEQTELKSDRRHLHVATDGEVSLMQGNRVWNLT